MSLIDPLHERPAPGHFPEEREGGSSGGRPLPAAGSRPPLRVLSFGWEFAPILSGGLGVACAGLARAMARAGIELTFVLPRLPQPIAPDGIRVVDARAAAATTTEPASKRAGRPGLRRIEIETPLAPYDTTESYARQLATWSDAGRRASARGADDTSLYGGDLLAEVERVAEAARAIAAAHPHDVIHCHDWMTFAAGIVAREVSGRPLVLHVHSTEGDRSGGGAGNAAIRAIEGAGLEAADRVVCVSDFTRGRVLEQYPAVGAARLAVVHNGIEAESLGPPSGGTAFSASRQVVLFLGRLTAQKGPEWFLRAAALVHRVRPEVQFVVAGSGELLPWMVERSAELGLAGSIFFTGFLSGDDIDRAYAMADVFVMPSVSEPFGLVPVEAMLRGTPAIVSRQSGVSEVVRHCLKVDFWDTADLADKIVGVLDHGPLADSLAAAGRREALRMDWDGPAARLVEIFRELARSGDAADGATP